MSCIFGKYGICIQKALEKGDSLGQGWGPNTLAIKGCHVDNVCCIRWDGWLSVGSVGSEVGWDPFRWGDSWGPNQPPTDPN